MPQYYVVNENTEDTFGAADDLQDAIRLAREVARQGQTGDLVSVLESGGKGVRQFVRMPDGTVVEQAIARPAKAAAGASPPNRAEPFAPADQPRD
jgi:hypothetical protein